MGLSYSQVSVVPSKHLEGLGGVFERRYARSLAYISDTRLLLGQDIGPPVPKF